MGYYIDGKIHGRGAWDGLIPAIALGFFAELGRLPKGVRSREFHIHISARRNLISLDCVEFRHLPKGGYNAAKKIHGRFSRNWLIFANFAWFVTEFCRFL